MFKFVKIAVVAGVLATLTACTGHIENKKITAATIIGGCGPAADQ
ncbi:DUF4223 family protein [Salmonella enterica]